MIKNIIFDIGNVLLEFKPAEFLIKFNKDKERIKKFVSKILWNKIWSELDRGTISLDEGKKIFQEQYPEENDLLNIFFDNWLDMFTPIQENVEILKKLKKKGYKIFALSNFIKEAFDYVNNRYNFFKLFDGIIISSEVKTIKPEEEIYKILLERFNLTPKECVFLDDHPSTLPPAKKLGIQTIRVFQNINLKKLLRNLYINI